MSGPVAFADGRAVVPNSNHLSPHAAAGRVAILTVLAFAVLCGCASIPGADFPKAASHALDNPEDTRLGHQFAIASSAQHGHSGFHIVSGGVDALLTRVQLIDAAEKTIDLQYYIFRGDETGRLLTGALLHAADRGVRVRILVDDGDTVAGDEQISALDAHQQIEIRTFNPFSYRGHNQALRALEFVFNISRLDYRMHNKLLVADNAVALVGGRNIGNEYFQMDPESQVADGDMFAAGPVAAELSATFDEFWNSDFSIPAEALGRGSRTAVADKAQRARAREPTHEQFETLQTDGVDYAKLLATGEPLVSLISGAEPLNWAQAEVVSDSPHKKDVHRGARSGRLMLEPIVDAARAVQEELLMITPYFIPADEELKILTDLRQRGVRVGVLTNSLMATTSGLAVFAGYIGYRIPLLEEGVQLYEVRSSLGSARGSGQSKQVSRYGNYALHVKMFVFDRKQIFVGSMNFDQRSKRLNTEVGLLIDSPVLAAQLVARFDRMVDPKNAFALSLSEPGADGQSKRRSLVWRTQESGAIVEFTEEPARGLWQRILVQLLSWLPIRREL